MYAVNNPVNNRFTYFAYLIAVRNAACSLCTMENIHLKIDYKGSEHHCEIDPVEATLKDGVPWIFSISLDGKFLGIMECTKEGWRMDRKVEPDLVETLGYYIHTHYE